MTITHYFNLLLDNPFLLITSLLTLFVILVNGWTDAPNAIATCISTKSISPRNAVIMAVIFNFLGVLCMTLINSTVTMTIFNMVDFSGSTENATAALCAAMVGILVWSIIAWCFGIPTSESHALIAGLSGAAIALQNGIGGINGSEWMKVIYGLILSTILGFGLGYLFARLIELFFRKANAQKANLFFRKAQVASGASMAFMHGAQDGQKFIGVFLLGIFLTNNQTPSSEFAIPVWLMILCSLVMGIGTSIGGYKIIKTVGMDMVKLKTYQGFATDLAASTCLLMSSAFGLPVSTTHTKTTAIMGVGASKRLSAVNWSIVKDMVITWVLTFPGCGLVGFLMAKLFILIF
ncbi:MAG: inorganic phosphate transporter [Clostridia bacterium]